MEIRTSPVSSRPQAEADGSWVRGASINAQLASRVSKMTLSRPLFFGTKNIPMLPRRPRAGENVSMSRSIMALRKAA